MIEPWEFDWGDLGPWGDLPCIAPTIPALLERARETHSEQDLLVIDDARLSYGEMERLSALLARQLLAAGVGKGCRIGVLLPNDETFPITWTAIARIGAVAVCLPSLARPAEIARIARHGDLHMLVVPRRYLHHDYVERLAEAFPGLDGCGPALFREDVPLLRSIRFWCAPGEDCPPWAARIDLAGGPMATAALLEAAEASVHPSDPAGIIYTSGSTAEPKGVIHSHGSFVRQGLKIAKSFDYRRDERAFATMPFFWVGGLTTTLMALMTVGGTILVTRETGDALLDFVEREGTTAVVTWPHILQSMAENPTFAGRGWSAMRNGLFYEALPPDRRPAEKALMGTPIGMTETNGPYTIVDRHCPPEQRGSVGRLMPGMEARLVDPETGEVVGEWFASDHDADSGGRIGEIYLRGDSIMLGMVKREREDIFRDGWYPTADLCSFKSGHIHYHGRCDDLIKAHGANVSPREVEAVLARIEGVASASVVGIPDHERGTIVAAAVVPVPGAILDADALRNEAARSLASYKVPRLLAVIAAGELPMLPSSKVDRRALQELLAGRR